MILMMNLMWMVAYSLAPAEMTSLHVALTLKLIFSDALVPRTAQDRALVTLPQPSLCYLSVSLAHYLKKGLTMTELSQGEHHPNDQTRKSTLWMEWFFLDQHYHERGVCTQCEEEVKERKIELKVKLKEGVRESLAGSFICKPFPSKK